MKTFIKGMLAVGIAVAVRELLKRAGRRQANARPDVVVSGGDALRVHAADGVFRKVAHEDAWRHEHAGAAPRALQVTVTGAGCLFPQNNRVEISASGKPDPLVIQREIDLPGGQWHTYVRPPQGATHSERPNELVFWGDGGSVALESIEVGDEVCQVPASVTATAVIAQVP